MGVAAWQAALRARSLSLAVACDDRLDSQSSSVVFFDKTCARMRMRRMTIDNVWRKNEKYDLNPFGVNMESESCCEI